MTLLEMKKKVLSLIEELNAESEYLTDDPDIGAKINYVINQKLFEMSRMKKLPKYLELEVAAGELIDFERIENRSGYAVYQLQAVRGVPIEMKADGTIIKTKQAGTLEIEFYAYPERIDADTDDEGYEFENSEDALEVLPYGVAGDLLKSDESAGYGRIYSEEFEKLKSELDPRYCLGGYVVEGGVYI